MTHGNETAAAPARVAAAKNTIDASSDDLGQRNAARGVVELRAAAGFLTPYGRRWLRWDLIGDTRLVGSVFDEKPKIETMRARKVPRGSTLVQDAWCELPVGARSGESGGWGFVFTGGVRAADGWLVALDVDGCREPQTGEVAPWAQRIITHYKGAYSEVTPSHTGLRIWLVVRERSNIGKRVPPAGTAPLPGAAKGMEIDPFGTTDAARYVTVTGDKLPEAGAAPLVVDNLDWLVENFAAKTEREATKDPGGAVPPAVGPTVTPEEIRRAILQRKDGEDLVAGNWCKLGYPSASECAFALMHQALIAANGHVEPVLDFFMTDTGFGRGHVDSRDPGKYEKRDWVLRQVEKAARTSHRLAERRYVASVFHPVSDSAPGVAGSPGTDGAPASAAAARPAPLLPVLIDPEERFAALSRSNGDGILVPRFLARGRNTTFTGVPKDGKSLFLQAAMSGWTLDEPRELDGFGKPPAPLRVLYCSENSADDDAVSLHAFDHGPTTRGGMFRLLNRAAVPQQIATFDEFLAWLAVVVRDDRFDVVVIDTLDAWIPDLEDSNSAAQVAARFASLSRILTVGCNIAVVVVLHAKKGSEPLSFDGILGSVKYRASGDTNIVMARVAPDDPADLRVVLRREGRDPWGMIHKACGRLPVCAGTAVLERDHDPATRLCYRLKGSFVVEDGEERARLEYVREDVPEQFAGTGGGGRKLSAVGLKKLDELVLLEAVRLHAAEVGPEPVSSRKLAKDGFLGRAAVRLGTAVPSGYEAPGDRKVRTVEARLVEDGRLIGHDGGGVTIGTVAGDSVFAPLGEGVE